jgi:hypothetical protein
MPGCGTGGRLPRGRDAATLASRLRWPRDVGRREDLWESAPAARPVRSSIPLQHAAAGPGSRPTTRVHEMPRIPRLEWSWSRWWARLGSGTAVSSASAANAVPHRRGSADARDVGRTGDAASSPAHRRPAHSAGAGIVCGLALSLTMSSMVRVGALLLFSLRWMVPAVTCNHNEGSSGFVSPAQGAIEKGVQRLHYVSRPRPCLGLQ